MSFPSRSNRIGEGRIREGCRINLDATRILFEVIRKTDTKTEGDFHSSIAVFSTISGSHGDEFLSSLTSYGTQKAIDELAE
jgi:hypothetical protein